MKFLFLCLPILIYANSLKDAYDYGDMSAGIKYAQQLKEEKKYEAAAEIFLNISQSKNPLNSAYYLGEMLEFGLGINQNCEKSGLFYWDSIAKGYCDAYLNISNTYKNGGCLIKSNIKSEKMLQKYNKCVNK